MRLGISLLTGFLLALSSPAVWGLSWLYPISLIFYFLLIDRYSFKKIWWTPLAVSWVQNWALYFWAPVALTEMWHFPLPVSLALWSPFALFSEAQWFLWIVVLKYLNLNLKNISVTQALLISSVYAGVESLFRFLFPDDIGLFFYYFPYLRQTFDLSSASLLSALYIFTNVVIYQHWQNKIRWSPALGTLLTLIVTGTMYGVVREAQVKNHPHITVKAGAIQPNLHHHERESARAGESEKDLAKKIMKEHYQLTNHLIETYPIVDIVLWPETTFPFIFQSPNSLYEKTIENELLEYIHQQNFYLVFGAFGITGTPPTNRNNIYLTKNNEPIRHFEKTVLFPFGEYIPLVNYFPILNKFFPKATMTKASLDQTVHSITIKDQKLITSAAICYEVLFTDKFRNSALKGTNLMFNVSNESWFLDWGEPQISLKLTAVRAIETKIPVIRSANTGHSAFISATGDIIQEQPLKIQSVIHHDLMVPLDFPPTLFTRWGDWFSKIGLLILVLWLAQANFRRRK